MIIKERGGKLGLYSLEKRRVRGEGGPVTSYTTSRLTTENME